MSYLPPSKYSRWYELIIKLAKNRTLSDLHNTEIHHIIPKSFYKSISDSGWIDGDPNDAENLVRLTMREHFVCHLLIIRMVTGAARGKMISAVWYMTNARMNHLHMNSRLYNSIRLTAMQNISSIQIELWNNKEWAMGQMERLQRPERRQHLRKVMTKIRGTDDARKMQSDINKELWAEPEYRKKRTLMMSEVNSRLDKRKSQSESNKSLWTPERRAAWSLRMKEVRNRPELVARQRDLTIAANARRREAKESFAEANIDSIDSPPSI